VTTDHCILHHLGGDKLVVNIRLPRHFERRREEVI